MANHYNEKNIISSSYKVVIKHRNKTAHLNKARVAQTVTAFLGKNEKFNIQRISSKLMICTTATPETANKLAAFNDKDKNINIFIPFNYNHMFGVIKGIDPDITDEELITNLVTPQDYTGALTSIRRFRFRGKNTSTVSLCFEGNTIPKNIFLWNLIIEVEPYRPRVYQCSECFKLGHLVKYCKTKNKKCENCHNIIWETPHDCENAQRCINCKEKHAPLNKDCPEYVKSASIVNLMFSQQLTFFEAKFLRNNNGFRNAIDHIPAPYNVNRSHTVPNNPYRNAVHKPRNSPPPFNISMSAIGNNSSTPANQYSDHLKTASSPQKNTYTSSPIIFEDSDSIPNTPRPRPNVSQPSCLKTPELSEEIHAIDHDTPGPDNSQSLCLENPDKTREDHVTNDDTPGHIHLIPTSPDKPDLSKEDSLTDLNTPRPITPHLSVSEKPQSTNKDHSKDKISLNNTDNNIQSSKKARQRKQNFNIQTLKEDTNEINLTAIYNEHTYTKSQGHEPHNYNTRKNKNKNKNKYTP